MHNMEECAMPTAKKTTAKSKATDSRVWIAEIPTSGDVGAYVLAAETDSTGAVLNNFTVIEAPEGDATAGLDTPGWRVVKTGLTLDAALIFIAGRVKIDLKDMATEPSPASVTPIKKAAAPKATAAKKAPAGKKKGLTRAAAPAKRTPAAAKAPAKKTPSRASATRKRSTRKTAS
jgi:hypothetical protein